MINKFLNLLNLLNLQRTSLIVSLIGISFQILVLNPNQNKISSQLNILDNKITMLENNCKIKSIKSNE